MAIDILMQFPENLELVQIFLAFVRSRNIPVDLVIFDLRAQFEADLLPNQIEISIMENDDAFINCMCQFLIELCNVHSIIFANAHASNQWAIISNYVKFNHFSESVKLL